MTQEEKQLLLKDLCARLPYNVNIQVYYEEIAGYGYFDETVWAVDNDEPFHINDRCIENIKPYLRPMSSMTEEEWLILKEWIFIASDTKGKIYFDGFRNISAEDTIKTIDYLISHHFDYRSLIEKGLALEAPEDMYKTE